MWEELPPSMAQLSAAKYQTWRLHGGGRKHHMQHVHRHWQQVTGLAPFNI